MSKHCQWQSINVIKMISGSRMTLVKSRGSQSALFLFSCISFCFDTAAIYRMPWREVFWVAKSIVRSPSEIQLRERGKRTYHKAPQQRGPHWSAEKLRLKPLICLVVMLSLRPTECWVLKGRFCCSNFLNLFQHANVTRHTLSKKKSPEDARFLDCDAASLGDCFQTFRNNLSLATRPFETSGPLAWWRSITSLNYTAELTFNVWKLARTETSCVLEGFSWKLIFGHFRKCFEKNSDIIKIVQE